MELKDRAKDLRQGGSARMLAARSRLAERDRQRLRRENEALQKKLDNLDAERARWMDTLEDLTRRPVTVNERRHLIRRSLVLSAAAGTAYLMGARAGRERFEQVRSWWEGLRAREMGSTAAQPPAAMDRPISPSGRAARVDAPSGASVGMDEGMLGTA